LLAHAGLALAKKAGDRAHIAAAHRLLEGIMRDLGNFPESERHLRSAALYFSPGADTVDEVVWNLSAGWHFYTKAALSNQQCEEAEDAFSRALKQASKRSMAVHVGEALLGLVWCGLSNGNIGAAEGNLVKAQRILSDTEDNAAAALTRLGSAQVAHARQQSNALDLYEKARNFAQVHAPLVCEADTWIGAGIIYWHANNRSQAEACWKSGLRCARRSSPTRARLARLSISRGKLEPCRTPL